MKKKIMQFNLTFLVIFMITAMLLLPAATTATVQAATTPVFSNATAAAGLPTSNGSWGWAWGDYDQDGYIDLFLGNHARLNEEGTDVQAALYRNNRTGAFSNQILVSGIVIGGDRHDMAFIDYDDDGDLDLWSSLGGRGGSGVEVPKELYKQNSNHSFTEVAAAAGVDYPLGRGRGSAWLDYDLDGDLDLFFTGAESDVAPNAFFENNGDGTFTNITAELGLDPFVGAQSQVSVADYDLDGDPDMFVTGTRWRLYRNDRTVFTPVEETAGIHASHSQGADWGDYDNDGDPDLYVTRGSFDGSGDYQEQAGKSDYFLANTGAADEDGLDITASGSLTFDIQEQLGLINHREPEIVFLGADGHHPAAIPFTLTDGSLVGDPPAYTPGVSSGYFIWQSAPGQWHVRWTGLGLALDRFSGIITAGTSITSVSEATWETLEVREQANQLFQNQGDGTFVEIGAAAGVADATDCRGVDWGDFDNDGDLDLFVSTAGTYASNPLNHLYRNNGNGTFTDVAASVGVGGSALGSTWGGLWADYDNDGFLDLLTNNGSWPWPLEVGGYELFHNGGNANHWLKIDVHGDTLTTQGTGVKIWATAGGWTQYRELNDSSHYFTHYTGPLHFGLGDTTQVDTLVVEWADGQQRTYNNVPADKVVELSLNNGISWQQEEVFYYLYMPSIDR